MALVGVTIMVGQNQEVERKSNVMVMARKGMSKVSVGITRRRVEITELQNHQALKGV